MVLALQLPVSLATTERRQGQYVATSPVSQSAPASTAPRPSSIVAIKGNWEFCRYARDGEVRRRKEREGIDILLLACLRRPKSFARRVLFQTLFAARQASSPQLRSHLS